MRDSDIGFMQRAIKVARDNAGQGGRPFGAIVVKDGAVVASAANEVHLGGGPTAHAEFLAVKRAGEALQSPSLAGCVVYASGHPCPFCVATMSLYGIRAAFYGYSREEFAELAEPPTYPPVEVEQLRPEGEAGLYEYWQTQLRSRQV